MEPVDESNEHLHYVTEVEALFASIGEGLIATNVAGKVSRVNQPALDIFGYERAELLGKRFTDKIVAVYESGRPLDVIDTPIAKSFLTGQVVSERAMYTKKDGSLVHVQVTVSPLLVEGQPAGAVQLFRDIASEIHMDKMKSDFISLASHQLRTPLASVNIYASMLGDGLAGKLTKQQAHFIAEIRSSAQRMNELIDTLLNISRIEAKGTEVNADTLKLDDLLCEMIVTFRPSAAKKHLVLAYTAAKKPFILKTDAHLVKEILVNLLSNAIKYTPNKGKVTLTATKRGKTVVICVQDTGYGIPPAAQRHIFSKFFRADNILPYDVSGTGLGLYLTKKIAENLGGDIWFESAEGEGSTFYFSLPLDDSTANSITAPA